MGNFWLVGAVIKQEGVGTRLSSIVRHLLIDWCNVNGGILHPSGISIVIGGESLLLRFQLHGMVSDESAMKYVLQNKGAAGLKPCARCCNIISKFHGKRFALQSDEVVRDITESDRTRFIKQTDAEIFEIMERLRVAHESSTAEEASQQEIVYGWNYCPAGLLMDPSTRHLLPPSRCYYDFLHILNSNGIVCLEITLFWTAVQKHTPLKLADLEAFVQSGFEFKKALNMGPAKVRKLFDPKLMDKHTYGGDAGQTVLALFILDFFAETVLFGVERLEPFLESFRCLAATCRWYFRFKAKRFNHIAHKSSFLIEKISQHLSAFVKCYSSQLVRPKHHFQFHAAEGMDTQEQVLDCWTLERKHRAYKDVAPLFPGNKTFESSALAKLLMVQEQQLSVLKSEPYLETSKEDPSMAMALGCARVLAGNALHSHCQTFCVGDICMFDDSPSQACRICGCLLVEWPQSLQRLDAVLVVQCMVPSDRKLFLEAEQWHLSRWTLSEKKNFISISARHMHLLWPRFWWQSGDIVTVSC